MRVSNYRFKAAKAKSMSSNQHLEMGAHEETLVEAALRVLNTADPFDKARLGDSVASRWLDGAITEPYNPSLDLHIPDRPARLSTVSAFFPVYHLAALFVFDEIPH